MDKDEAKSQKERIELLRSKLSHKNYEFVRKEVMLGPNVDITHLFEPHAFQRFYAFKD